jgi:hypothetical protein
MLDFIGTIVLAAAIMVSVNALTGAMPISTSQRLALSVGAGLWTGLAAALASANLFLGTNPVGPPTIGMMIVFRWLRPPLRRRSRRRCALRCSECRCLS